MKVQQYNKEYYQKHRERISEHRKAKWREDPEYRQQIQNRRQVYLARKKAARMGLPPAKRGRQFPNTPRVIRREGMVELVYSTGATASRLGVKYPTLRGWAARGIIPTITDTGGRHWFAEWDIKEMVRIREALQVEGRDGRVKNAAVKTAVYRRRLERHYTDGERKKGT